MMYSGDDYYGDNVTSPLYRQVAQPTAILECPFCTRSIAYFGDVDGDEEAITLGTYEEAVCECGAFFGEDDELEVKFRKGHSND